MATATLMRPQQSTGTWSAIFPPDQVTEQQSALFVKKLLAVAISNITYLRNIFPEHAFGDKCLEELNLKILRDDSACPGACQVIKWVKGCFDALDKKYLRMLIIGIYVDPDDPETVIESYTFKFSYKDDGGIDIYRNQTKVSSAYGAAETKSATIKLLRTIIVLTQTLKSLPNDVMMTMKLLYYDDVTPTDYEPPGFRATESESFHFEQEPMTIKVGDVSTSFHTVKMRIKTDGSQFLMKDDTAEAVVDDVGSEVTNEGLDVEVPELSSTHQESESGKDIYDFKDESQSQPMNPSLSKSHCPEPMQCNDVPKESPMKPQQDATVLSSEQTPRSEVEQEDYGVKCACGCNEDDGLMILCSVCKYWQHGVCFKVLSEDEAPADHICNECSQAKDVDKASTDPYLDGLSTIAVQATCLWRRALVACTETTKVLAPLFSKRLGVEVTVAQGLINRLEKEGYLKNPAKGKKLGKIVMNQKIVTDGYAKYFKQNKSKHVKSNEQEEKESSKSAEPVKTNDSTVTEMEIENKENEVDILAEKTKSLSLSKQKRRKGDSSAVLEVNQKNNKKQLRSSPLPPSKLEEEKPVKVHRGRKRAISKVDGAAEFEISDSQDVDSCHSHSSKKASIASKAIMV